MSRGVWFAGSQNAAQFCQPYYDVWLPQFFLAHLLERRVEWIDAGLFGRYSHDLVVRSRAVFDSSWIEEAMRSGALVANLRDECQSLTDVGDILVDGTWGIGVSRPDARRLAELYDSVTGRQCVTWNEGREAKVFLGEALRSRIIKVFNQAAVQPDPDGNGFWNYVHEVGEPVLARAIQLTERAHRGVRVADFATALHEHLFGELPFGGSIPLSDLVQKAGSGGDGLKIRFLCKLVTDLYADNFAAHTTGRQFALAVNGDTRTVILNRTPGVPDQEEKNTQQFVPCAQIQFPTWQEFLRVRPALFGEMRQHGSGYFDALDRWKEDPSVANANDFADSVRQYTERICRIVDQTEKRPFYAVGYGAADTFMSTLVSGSVLAAMTQFFPNISATFCLGISALGAAAGIGLNRALIKSNELISEGRRREARTWDVDGSSQPAGSPEEKQNQK